MKNFSAIIKIIIKNLKKIINIVKGLNFFADIYNVGWVIKRKKGSMYLGTIQSTVAADFRKIDGVSRKEDAKVDNVVGKKTDKTSLSSEAREAVETAAAVKVLSARVEAQPDIRQDKVDAVRQKIDSGFYESQEFASNLADKLIGDLGF